MLVQEYNGYKKNVKVGKSKEELYDDLECYCNLHSEKSICYYEHPFDCVMEIRIFNNEEDVVDSYFWKVAQY